MNHEYFMQLALEEAQKGEGLVSPNPLVGSLLVQNGEIVAKGFHGEMGKLHAERVVLEKMKNASAAAEKMQNDSILYVTLEPCCHHGKTPPCTDAILESGIKHIVCAQVDPNPLVAGKGIEMLRNAGIQVEVGVLEEQAQEQIRFFRHWMEKKEPYFTGKLAVSADGFYAKNGENMAISSPETKSITRSWRKAYDAILVGKQTLLIDNPHLGTEGKELLRIVLCQKADFSIQGLQVFRDGNVILACKEKTESCDFAGEIIFYTDLQELKKKLFERGIQSVLVEGGGEILEAMLQESLLQELMIVQSKNTLLHEGKAFKLPVAFTLKKEVDLGADVVEIYMC